MMMVNERMKKMKKMGKKERRGREDIVGEWVIQATNPFFVWVVSRQSEDPLPATVKCWQVRVSQCYGYC